MSDPVALRMLLWGIVSISLYLFIGRQIGKMTWGIWFYGNPSRDSLSAFVMFPKAFVRDEIPADDRSPYSIRELNGLSPHDRWYRDDMDEHLGKYTFFWPILAIYNIPRLITALGELVSRKLDEDEPDSLGEMDIYQLIEHRSEKRAEYREIESQIERLDEEILSRREEVNTLVQSEVEDRMIERDIDEFERALLEEVETDE